MKKYVIVIFCLITFILGSVFAVKWYERHQTNKIVMKYLQEKSMTKISKPKKSSMIGSKGVLHKSDL